MAQTTRQFNRLQGSSKIPQFIQNKSRAVHAKYSRLSNVLGKLKSRNLLGKLTSNLTLSINSLPLSSQICFQDKLWGFFEERPNKFTLKKQTPELPRVSRMCHNLSHEWLIACMKISHLPTTSRSGFDTLIETLAEKNTRYFQVWAGLNSVLSSTTITIIAIIQFSAL